MMIYWCCCWCGMDRYAFYFISNGLHWFNSTTTLFLSSSEKQHWWFLSRLSSCAWRILYAPSPCKTASMHEFESVFPCSRCAHVLVTQSEHSHSSQRERERGGWLLLYIIYILSSFIISFILLHCCIYYILWSSPSSLKKKKMFVRVSIYVHRGINFEVPKSQLQMLLQR